MNFMDIFKNKYYLDMITKFHVYSIAFCSITFLLVYVIPLATIISNQPKLVNDYYYKKFNQHFIFDFFLVGVYILLFEFLKKYTDFNIHILMSLICVSIAITAYVLIVHVFKNKSSFFYDWFTKAGVFRAATYDIILVNSMLFVYSFLLKKLK
jgi:hypothetical protein